MSTQNTAALFNRKQYMANEISHQEYYAQFCTPAVFGTLLGSISEKEIKASQDKAFNDIVLSRWDRLHLPGDAQRLVAESNASTSGGVRSFSLSDTVCIFKAAAQIVRERE